MKRIALGLVLTVFLFCACGVGGGGSGDSVPDISSNSFVIDPPVMYAPGYKMSFGLSGQDNSGNLWTGMFRMSTRSSEIGEEGVIAQEILLTLTSQGITSSGVVTTYFDEDHKPVRQVSSYGDVLLPVKIQQMPLTAEIGDFGTNTSWIDTNGNTTTGTWELRGASDDLAELISVSVIKNSAGETLYYEENAFTIDNEGDPKSVRANLHYPAAGVTVELSGDRTYDT